jgi:uncharacterized protein (TIGR03032 family)
MSNPDEVSPAGMEPATTVDTLIRCQATASFPALLQQLGVSLLVSTIGAGKLAVLGTWNGIPAFSFHDFERTIGVAVRPNLVAIGTTRQIWFLRAAPQLTPYLEPRGKYDACFLTRLSHYTGEIHAHELAWAGEELWVVNTLFSCLCTLSPEYSFMPRWRPPFVSALVPEDRCHLNGLALENGRPRFVTMLGETNAVNGWRAAKATSGCLIDVPSGATVVRGLSMPHSPRFHAGRLWLLESGKGHLSVVDSAAGRAEPVASLPGYARGLDFHGPYAFVGMSRIRETSEYDGLPISPERAKLICGVAVIDTRSGQLAASFEFQSGVREIFSVQVIAGVRCPAISPYNPLADGDRPIWLLPSPQRRS